MSTLTKTRKRWTDLAIETELRAQCDELGHFPSRRELAAAGQRNLWDAIRRAGGVDSWRRRMDSPLEVDGAPVDGAPVDGPPVHGAPVNEARAHIAAFEGAPAEISADQIAVRAFELYEHGTPGDALAHWFAAEDELAIRRM